MSGTLCTCGCCSGLNALAPESNAPGQPALNYRRGTYAVFLQRMLSQISSPNSLANPPEGPWSIANLSTRSNDDPTIALIDAWSVVLDVLTFYQERIVNEGFLRTATEHRSVLELASRREPISPSSSRMFSARLRLLRCPRERRRRARLLRVHRLTTRAS